MVGGGGRRCRSRETRLGALEVLVRLLREGGRAALLEGRGARCVDSVSRMMEGWMDIGCTKSRGTHETRS